MGESEASVKEVEGIICQQICQFGMKSIASSGELRPNILKYCMLSILFFIFFTFYLNFH